MNKSLNLSLGMLLACGGASSLSAQNIYWGAAGAAGNWATVGSWYADAGETTPAGAVPTIANDVIFNTTPDNALGGTITVGANIFARSLTFNTSAGTLLSQSGSRILTLGIGGITVNSGAGNATIGQSAATLSVQAAGDQTWTNNSTSVLNVRKLSTSNTASGPVAVTLNANAGSITFSLGIDEDAAKPLSLIIESTGTATVSMVGSTYTGGTTIKRGVLASNGNIGAGTVVLSGTGADTTRLNLTGAATNDITVQAGGPGLAALTGNSGADFQGDITLNRDVSLGSVSTSAQTVIFSGDISGNSNITIGRVAGGSSNPTVVLSGNNTYVGRTIIDSAIVVVNSLNSVVGGSSSSSLGAAPLDAAAGTIRMSGVTASTLRYAGTGETTDRVIEIASNAGATLDMAGTGLLKFTSDLSHSGTGGRTLTLTGTGAGVGEFAGAINNVGTGTNVGVTKNGIGTWRLSGTANSYSSVTSITAGVLEVTKLADSGQNSSIGTGSSGGLSIAGGTLRYIGSGDSSNRAITIGALGATLDASGSGAIVYSRTAAPSYGSGNVAISLTLTGTNTGTNTWAANQNNNGTGAVSLTKNGSGTWVLTGTSTNTGGTTVNAGTLLLNGSSAAGVTVFGGVFGGTGTVANSVTIGNSGTLAPGNSPGTINTQTLTLSGTGSTIAMEISGTGAGQYDQVNVTGGVNLDGNGKIEVNLLSFVPQPSEIYFLILNDGVDAISGTLYGIAQGGTFTSGGYTWQVSYTGNSTTSSFTGGNDLALQVVPEPGAWMLVSGGLMAMTFMRRRRSS
jgi:fibronectin-binding autotransporter adhesin